MSQLPEYERKSSRAVPIAMIVLGLLAVFMGLLDPGGASQPRPSGYTTAQLELIRADAAGGFPRPPLPDNPPRGPGQ
jgi:hypothetical protein